MPLETGRGGKNSAPSLRAHRFGKISPHRKCDASVFLSSFSFILARCLDPRVWHLSLPFLPPRRNLCFRELARRFFFAVFYCKSWPRPKHRFGFKRPRLLFVVVLLLFLAPLLLGCSWVRESFRRSEWRCPWLTRW